MPNSFFNQPVFIPGGNPERMNEPSYPYLGMLGVRFNIINPPRTLPSDSAEDGRPKAFQLVRSDSTMSVAPYNGAVAWWANQAQYLVTTNAATPGRGRVAGIFKSAVTPGNYCCVQFKGPATVKFVDAPTATPDVSGKIVVPSATNSKADCLAAGSAATYPEIGRTAGVYNGADATAIVDLDIPEVL